MGMLFVNSGGLMFKAATHQRGSITQGKTHRAKYVKMEATVPRCILSTEEKTQLTNISSQLILENKNCEKCILEKRKTFLNKHQNCTAISQLDLFWETESATSGAQRVNCIVTGFSEMRMSRPETEFKAHISQQDNNEFRLIDRGIDTNASFLFLSKLI